MNENSSHQCPFCKEDVKAEATKCKHCGSRIAAARPEHGGICPFCKEAINPEAVLCKHCKSNLQAPKDCGCSEASAGLGILQSVGLQRPSTSVLSAARANQCETWCVGSTLMCACPVHIPGMGDGIIIYACGTCINDPIITAFAP
jgi:hypothetical protein